MSNLVNPYAVSILGKPLAPAPVPQLRAEGAPMSRAQLDMARWAFGRFMEQARLSFDPSPSQHGFLPDGSRFRIVSALGAQIMQVWPAVEEGEINKIKRKWDGGILLEYKRPGNSHSFAVVQWRQGEWQVQHPRAGRCGVFSITRTDDKGFLRYYVSNKGMHNPRENFPTKFINGQGLSEPRTTVDPSGFTNKEDRALPAPVPHIAGRDYYYQVNMDASGGLWGIHLTPWSGVTEMAAAKFDDDQITWSKKIVINGDRPIGFDDYSYDKYPPAQLADGSFLITYEGKDRFDSPVSTEEYRMKDSAFYGGNFIGDFSLTFARGFNVSNWLVRKIACPPLPWDEDALLSVTDYKNIENPAKTSSSVKIKSWVDDGIVDGVPGVVYKTEDAYAVYDEMVGLKAIKDNKGEITWEAIIEPFEHNVTVSYIGAILNSLSRTQFTLEGQCFLGCFADFYGEPYEVYATYHEGVAYTLNQKNITSDALVVGMAIKDLPPEQEGVSYIYYPIHKEQAGDHLKYVLHFRSPKPASYFTETYFNEEVITSGVSLKFGIGVEIPINSIVIRHIYDAKRQRSRFSGDLADKPHTNNLKVKCNLLQRFILGYEPKNKISCFLEILVDEGEANALIVSKFNKVAFNANINFVVFRGGYEVFRKYIGIQDVLYTAYFDKYNYKKVADNVKYTHLQTMRTIFAEKSPTVEVTPRIYTTSNDGESQSLKLGTSYTFTNEQKPYLEFPEYDYESEDVRDLYYSDNSDEFRRDTFYFELHFNAMMHKSHYTQYLKDISFAVDPISGGVAVACDYAKILISPNGQVTSVSSVIGRSEEYIEPWCAST